MGLVNVEIVNGDVVDTAADVLLLKYARSFHGADEAVALRLTHAGGHSEASISPDDGDFAFVDSRGAVAPARVLFLGTPYLGDFRYREIRQFAWRAIEILAERAAHVETIATTIHGAGYGLDIEEALRSMILGFQQGLVNHPLPNLKKVLLVERNKRRFKVLGASLADIELVLPEVAPASSASTPSTPVVTTEIGMLDGSAFQEPLPGKKKTVFVAMPFVDEFEDVYQFGIYQTVRKCGYVCEKVDESIFAGSIVERIMDGIRNAEFVIADLTHERPNVYLEVGYAWGLKKPVIMVAREGQHLHFDLRHHKCIFYKTITRLAESLEKTIRDMFESDS